MMDEKQLLDYIRQSYPNGLVLKDLVQRLKKRGVEKQVIHVLAQRLVETGKLMKFKGDRYGLPKPSKQLKLVTGRLQSFAKGFGFVIPDESDAVDVFVEGRDFLSSIHGDRVTVRVEGQKKWGKPQGKIVKLIERGHSQIVGRLELSQYGYYLIPDEKRIFQDISISPKKVNAAKPGQKVVVEILEDKKKGNYLEAQVIKVLGFPNELGVDIESVIAKYELPGEFPKKAVQIAEWLSKQPINTEDRVDFRDLTIITIDPEDAKDLDDAISLECTSDGHYHLGVHIADVSYYIKEGDLLDQEAYKRGTSVYLVDRVVPMLPPQLSNGICSLHPGVDRLAYSCMMEFDENGNQVRSYFADSIIKTNYRLNYEEVQSVYDGNDKEVRVKYKEIMPLLGWIKELALKLRKNRATKGSVDFNIPETKVILDHKGKPIELRKIENTLSHQVIEECMLAANETVASFMAHKQLPFIYRVHPSPNVDKLRLFADFIRELGYKLKITDPMESKQLQQLVQAAKGKPEERLINNLLLRSMQEARYAVENIGHFGLAKSYYTHFTSPIRRYPDLIVHRYLRKTLRKSFVPEDRAKLEARLNDICQQSCRMERTSMEAERESIQIKKIEYMLTQMGKVFHGVISGMMPFGFFVELQEVMVDGLVSMDALGADEFIYLEEEHVIKGRKSKVSFRLGDRVKVRVVRVDQEARELDLVLV